jgi:hypothetical protein
MPDIGLLQGPPRPKLILVPKPAGETEAPVVVPPVIAMPLEEEAIKVAAHVAVVSDRRPVAEVSAALPEEPEVRIPEPRIVSMAPAFVPVAAVAPVPARMPVDAAAATSTAATTAVATAAAPTGASAASPTDSRDTPRHSTPAAPASNYSLPPIRLSDLLWLLLALVLIIGTGLGIRDPWPADEPRFASVARDMVSSG